MIWILFFIAMGYIARLAGRGVIGKFAEAMFTLPFGLALAYTSYHYGAEIAVYSVLGLIGWIVSYLGMQSATWTFLRWETHSDPDLNRSSTLKPFVDWLAGKFNYKLGDEGYAWISAAVKGFIIGLPVGGIFTAILWPIGYEIGSHAHGRVEKYFPDPHAFAEFFSGFGGGLSILLFLKFIII